MEEIKTKIFTDLWFQSHYVKKAAWLHVSILLWNWFNITTTDDDDENTVSNIRTETLTNTSQVA